MTAGQVGQLVARGSKLQADVAAAVLDGGLHLTLDEVSQLEVTLADPDGRLAAGRLLGPGATLSLGAYPLEVTAYEMGETRTGRYLTVTALSKGAQQLRQARGEKTWKLTPSQWVQRSAEFYGLKAVVEPSTGPAGVTRGGPDPMDPTSLGESSYETLQRLAKEEGRIAFEALGTLYYGRPSWLVANLPHAVITWGPHAKVDGGLLRMPTCRRTTSDPDAPRTVDLHVVGDVAVRYRPGMAITLRGVPDFETRYLVTEVRVPFGDLEPGLIRARTVIDPAAVGDALTVGTAAPTAGDRVASDVTFARFVNALVLQESGGDYRARGAVLAGGDRALGRYQILASNVPSWSRLILGYSITAATFHASDALQDAVAIGMLRRYYEEHGARGAASKWYSGRPELQNDTRPQKHGPSIKDYVDSVIRRMASAPSTLPAGYTGPGSALVGERGAAGHLSTRWLWPCDTGVVTSRFGPRRQPAGGGSTDHKGIDIGMPVGTPIVASKPGRVTFAGTASGYGIVIYLDHGGGVTTRYAHLSQMLVRRGQTVEQGQRIALSGNSGIFTTGPHLHFEVRRNDVAEDPLRVLPQR